MMGGVSGGDDDFVQIHQPNKPGDPFIITFNCPDKTGLACDICRIILDFGLCITKGDVSTDGVWCYFVLWVIPHSVLLPITCSYLILKERLQEICPPCLASFYIIQQPSRSSPVYLLKELSHTRNRQDETCERLNAVLRDSCTSCELQLAGPEYEYNQGISSLSPALAEELFRCELSDNQVRSQALTPDMTKLKKANVAIDNYLSPAHTLVQIRCADHKGRLYDIMRTLKDMNMKISYGRFSPNSMGYRDLDIFIQQNDGKKILDREKQSALCSHLKQEMLHPLRVIIANRGPDTELLVANPVELSGIGRPRVFYDVTFALKTLGICVFSAEVGRHSTSEREWEVYRFLLDENCEFQLTGVAARNKIVNRVRRTLMGW
ncbi:ACT domain-containing protein ACR9 [Glycine soja]